MKTSTAPAEDETQEWATKVHKKYLRDIRRFRAKVVVTQIAILAFLVGAWQLGPRWQLWDPLLTSTPAAVFTTFVGLIESGNLIEHVRTTVVEVLLSFVIGMLLGLAIAVLLWWSRYVSEVLDPYLVVANAMPKIALAPLLYVWLGPVLSIYGMTLLIATIVTILMAYNAFESVDVDKLKLVRVFGGGKRELLTKVVLPGSGRALLATAKVTMGLTLIGVIVGEFISSEAGLGYLIVYGSNTFAMSLVMTAIVLLVILSIILYGAIGLIEKLLARRWRLDY